MHVLCFVGTTQSRFAMSRFVINWNRVAVQNFSLHQSSLATIDIVCRLIFGMTVSAPVIKRKAVTLNWFF